MSGTQTDLEGIPVDYAQPPDLPPTPRDRVPDWLQLRAAEYTQAERTGIIEGALWACRRFLELSPCGVESTAVDVEAALRKRFGDEHIDREKRLHEGRTR